MTPDDANLSICLLRRIISFLRWAGNSESKLIELGENSMAWGERVDFSARGATLGSKIAANGERLEADMMAAAGTSGWMDFCLNHLANFASLDLLWGISETNRSESVPVGKEDNNELLRCYLLQVNTSAGECSPEAAICSNEPPSSPERRAARD